MTIAPKSGRRGLLRGRAYAGGREICCGESETADPSAPPRFPVETCGFGQLLVVLFRENHISGTGESGEVGNPGTLGMTKGRANVPWKVAAGPMRYAFQDL